MRQVLARQPFSFANFKDFSNTLPLVISSVPSSFWWDMLSTGLSEAAAALEQLCAFTELLLQDFLQLHSCLKELPSQGQNILEAPLPFEFITLSLSLFLMESLPFDGKNCCDE